MTVEGRPATPAALLYGKTPVFHPAFSASWAYESGMPLYRMKMTWTGFVGSPGYTNLYFLNPEEPTLAIRDTTAGRVRTFFQGLTSYLSNQVNIAYPSEMEHVDTATGDLLDIQPLTGQANTVGTQTAGFSAAVGACVTWNTEQIVNGRRLRGRTFLVPLASAAYQTDGTLIDTTRTSINTAASALCNYNDNLVLSIWHRPSTGGSDGVAAEASSASVRDRTAVLRSRRN